MSDEPECFGLTHPVIRRDDAGNQEEGYAPCTTPNCTYCAAGRKPTVMRDVEATECVGGFDPLAIEYVDRIRPKCGFFESCGKRVGYQTASLEEQARRHLPVVRPQATVPAAPPQPTPQPVQQVQQIQQVTSPTRSVSTEGMTAQRPEMMLVPTSMVLPNVLEAPEPTHYNDGTPVSLLLRLLVDFFRAAFSAGSAQLGKSISRTPWLTHRKPPPPP